MPRARSPDVNSRKETEEGTSSVIRRSLNLANTTLFLLTVFIQAGCQNVDPNLICETVDGVETCVCAAGWEDDGNAGCQDVDECVVDPNACDPNASCTNLRGSHACECLAGWFGDGSSCEDVDECAQQDGLCGENASCVNTPGSYACACDEGYEGDGQTCSDVNECEAELPVCDPNSQCANTVGDFECTCNAGWEGDGSTCTDVDECLTTPCNAYALCTNTDGAYECACQTGWEGDGVICTDIDECQTLDSPCDPNSECANTEGAYECICFEGWEWNGSVCTPICGDGLCMEEESCQTCGEDCSNYGASEETTTLDDQEQAFLVIINDYRAQNDLGSLTACRSLNRAAQGHSEDMRDQNYFAHQGLNGSSPWDRACGACYELGCGPKTAMSENIAAGNEDAQKTFTQWKNSPGHNKNMLSPSVSYIGIGRALGGGQYGVYWTNVFGGNFEQSCE